MSTVTTIQAEVKKAGKALSRTAILFHLKTLGISHVGARQRPQRYPDDAGEMIKQHLGLSPRNGKGAGVLPFKEIKRRATGKAA